MRNSTRIDLGDILRKARHALHLSTLISEAPDLFDITTKDKVEPLLFRLATDIKVYQDEYISGNKAVYFNTCQTRVGPDEVVLAGFAVVAVSRLLAKSYNKLMMNSPAFGIAHEDLKDRMPQWIEAIKFQLKILIPDCISSLATGLDGMAHEIYMDNGEIVIQMAVPAAMIDINIKIAE